MSVPSSSKVDEELIPVSSFRDWLVHETIGVLLLTGICSIVLSGLVNGVSDLILGNCFMAVHIVTTGTATRSARLTKS